MRGRFGKAEEKSFWPALRRKVLRLAAANFIQEFRAKKGSARFEMVRPF